MAVKTPDTKQQQDAAYNPGELHSAEQFPEGYASSGIDQLEKHAKGDATGKNPGSNVESLKAKESQQAKSGGWQNNYTGQSGQSRKRKIPLTFAGSFAKRGPMALIFALLFGGAGFVGLFAPGALIVSVKETMAEKFNDQLTAMEKRNLVIIKKKLAGTTDGICGKITLRCRYNTMGNRQVKRLEAAGVKINKKTSPIPTRTRIASFEFEGRTITAPNFARELESSATFRSAMIRGYSPKLAGFADKLFGKLAAKLGINKQANITGDTDEERQKAITDAANGTAAAEESAKVTSTEEDCDGGEGCEDGKRKKYFDDTGTEITKAEYDEIIANNSTLAEEFRTRRSLEETGRTAAKGTLKGALTSTALGLGAVDSACTGYVLIRTVSAAAQYIGAVQMLRYAQVFMNTADLIKAGDAKPEQVETAGKILTSTNAAGKSGTDSYGYHYAAYNDYDGMPRKDAITPESIDGNYNNVVLTEQQKKDVELSDETTKYINGQLVTENLLTQLIAGIEGSHTTAALDSTCRFVKSGWGQTIIIGTALVGAVVAFFSGGASLTWGAGLQVAASVAISVSIAMLTPKLIQMASGTMIGQQELKNGHRSMNAIVSGEGAMNHATSMTRGVPALSKNSVDLVAYQQETQKVKQQYAELDRLQYSPLDPSSPNTFMGTLVTRLLPYTSKMSSLSGSITSMTQLNLATFASLLPNASAADPTDEFNVCPDRDYQDMNMAADPFCNPKHYMKSNPDPEIVLDYMESHDYVEKDTEDGQPKDGENDYGQYVKNCMERSVAIGGYTEENDNKGEECILGSASTAKEALPENNPTCNAGNEGDNTECKRNMFRLMFEDASIDDGMENGYAAGGGATTASQANSAAPAECTSMATDDLGQIACKAYQFDPYGYLWGGGHGGTAKGFMADFKAGKYTPNQDAILDCSGLVRMAIYDAFGVDIGGVSTEGYRSLSKFKEIKLEEAKAGDILYKPGHTEIIVSNNTSQKRYTTFGAHTANTAQAKQIGPSSYSYSSVSNVYRFQK
jgi:cell wall-associated NlpC family hydrolase